MTGINITCMYCGKPPGNGTFTIEGTGPNYHDWCKETDAFRRELQRAVNLHYKIVEKTIEWVHENHHYGDIPECDAQTRHEIIMKAHLET